MSTDKFKQIQDIIFGEQAKEWGENFEKFTQELDKFRAEMQKAIDPALCRL